MLSRSSPPRGPVVCKGEGLVRHYGRERERRELLSHGALMGRRAYLLRRRSYQPYDLLQLIDWIRALEERLPGEELGDDAAGGPHIDGGAIGGVVAQDLREKERRGMVRWGVSKVGGAMEKEKSSAGRCSGAKPLIAYLRRPVPPRRHIHR